MNCFPTLTVERHLRNFRWKNPADVAHYREGLLKAGVPFAKLSLVRTGLEAHGLDLARSAPSRIHSIAKALETIATGLRSAALDSVTRPKLMVRPSRTTRASASTSEAVTARMKCVV